MIYNRNYNMAKVLLTADRTLMSDYYHLSFSDGGMLNWESSDG